MTLYSWCNPLLQRSDQKFLSIAKYQAVRFTCISVQSLFHFDMMLPWIKPTTSCTGSRCFITELLMRFSDFKVLLWKQNGILHKEINKTKHDMMKSLQYNIFARRIQQNKTCYDVKSSVAFLFRERLDLPHKQQLLYRSKCR